MDVTIDSPTQLINLKSRPRQKAKSGRSYEDPVKSSTANGNPEKENVEPPAFPRNDWVFLGSLSIFLSECRFQGYRLSGRTSRFALILSLSKSFAIETEAPIASRLPFRAAQTRPGCPLHAPKPRGRMVNP
jgi:hypothetical protein